MMEEDVLQTKNETELIKTLDEKMAEVTKVLIELCKREIVEKEDALAYAKLLAMIVNDIEEKIKEEVKE